MRNYFMNDTPVHFVFPLDGDCLNEFDGVKKNGIMVMKVIVNADKGADLYINEIKAIYNGTNFEAIVPLYGFRNTLYAEDKKTKNSSNITVFKLENPTKKFRVSVDDVILCLADITRNKDRYHSIFDNPYLAIFKEAHDRYDSPVHLNLFYETDDMRDFRNKYEYFNLSMMTDAFKQEWIDNADWLRLSFHARREHPDNPYENTNLNEIREDCEAVHKEIIRFAGKKSLSKVTTIHWGALNETGLRVLRTMGYQGLVGYFEVHDGKSYVSYHYPIDFVNYIGKRDFWKDNQEDMIFGRTDIVLNLCTIDHVIPRLNEIKQHPHRAGFIEMLIHEQYFYEDYAHYIKEYKDIILNSCKWAIDNSYEPSLMADVMFEK